MPTATITSKGRVTIPTTVRASLGIKTGDRVEFVQVEPGRFEIVAATQSAPALKGMIRKPPTAVTVEAMNEALPASVRRRRPAFFDAKFSGIRIIQQR